jgi:CheY-like chemotaxis protein
VKYNRTGGEVTIDGERLTPDRYRITVTDTGAGIPASKIALLFHPFERLGAEQTAVEGTGLGLALSRALAEAMGGTLGVNSVIDRGSTFWVDLPAAEQRSERSPALSATPSPVMSAPEPTNAGTIVYVEDNLSNVRLMERILQQRPGLTLHHAPNGNSAFDLIRERHPDLVLLDMHLPDMSGEEVLHHLWADPASRSIPIVVVTADATPGLARRLKAAGATACITKPLNLKELLDLVDTLLSKQPKVGEV